MNYKTPTYKLVMDYMDELLNNNSITKKELYDKVNEKYHVPRPSIRRIARQLRDDYYDKVSVLSCDADKDITPTKKMQNFATEKYIKNLTALEISRDNIVDVLHKITFERYSKTALYGLMLKFENEYKNEKKSDITIDRIVNYLELNYV